MKALEDMGNTEKQAGKMLALMLGAVLALVAILTTFFSGEKANWQPITDFFSEIVAAGGAGTASFIIMQRVKVVFPTIDKLRQSYLHIGIAVSLGPLAWLGLVWAGLDTLTQQGAIIVMLASITTGRQIYAHYKDKRDKAGAEVTYIMGSDFANAGPEPSATVNWAVVPKAVVGPQSRTAWEALRNYQSQHSVKLAEEYPSRDAVSDEHSERAPA